MKPYYSDKTVTLYLGDMREILPALALQADLVCADPPYGETALTWDRWVDGWPTLAATVTRSLWCFGSMRMFLDHGAEFTAAGWKLSQDIVWEKHNGSGFQNDRFKRVHEHALHWYLGDWRGQHRQVPTTPDATPRTVRRKQCPTHMGEIGTGVFTSEDGGPRLMRSVLRCAACTGGPCTPATSPPGSCNHSSNTRAPRAAW